MAALIAIITTAASAAEPVMAAADYPALDKAARQRLATAFEHGDSKQIEAAATTLDSINRARYLAGASVVVETVVNPIITGFGPQIASAPDAIKAYVASQSVSMSKGTDSSLLPQMAQALNIWLSAQNTAAAKLAVGDLMQLLPVQEKADKAFSKKMSELSDSATSKDREKPDYLEDRQRQAKDAALKAAKEAPVAK